MKNNLKNNKGITLVALVVTIVVLLILAGVSINLVLGDNGIIMKSKEAKIEHNHANIKEQISFYKSELDIENGVGETNLKVRDYLLNNGYAKEVNGTIELVANKVVKNSILGKGTNKKDVYTYENGKLYYYDEKGNQTILMDIEENFNVNYDEIMADIQANYTTYLEKAKAIGQVTDENIGIDEYGNIVNLDLWGYYLIAEDEMCLGKNDYHYPIKGYKGKILNGKIEGNIPIAIYRKNKNRGSRVTSLEATFSYCDNLTSITIPNSVTDIGDCTFSYCDNLTSITIPNSVTNIAYQAFSDCKGLKSITIPNGVKYISGEAFMSCDNLTSITIPNSVENIGGAAFSFCTSLKSITISNGVKYIGDNAFLYCTALTDITIPNSVIGIGKRAFSGCTNLVTINVKNSEKNLTGAPWDAPSSTTINWNYTGE